MCRNILQSRKCACSSGMSCGGDHSIVLVTLRGIVTGRSEELPMRSTECMNRNVMIVWVQTMVSFGSLFRLEQHASCPPTSLRLSEREGFVSDLRKTCKLSRALSALLRLALDMCRSVVCGRDVSLLRVQSCVARDLVWWKKCSRALTWEEDLSTNKGNTGLLLSMENSSDEYVLSLSLHQAMVIRLILSEILNHSFLACSTTMLVRISITMRQTMSIARPINIDFICELK
ncbi:hypothetical protein Tco_1370286 [Tanacetum coccineum]|uniref:Uncharacterized protein n=1 Tax=Tanacetum coccineum TaxID=301880 RepID=A0ABQ5ERH6_9ASTR